MPRTKPPSPPDMRQWILELVRAERSGPCVRSGKYEKQQQRGSRSRRPARYHRAGIRPSMGTLGDACDNALCESFFGTLECELLDRTRLQTPVQAERAVFQFIEGWYNPHHRHSALNYDSPKEHEKRRLGVA